jgi:hypothetical protein
MIASQTMTGVSRSRRLVELFFVPPLVLPVLFVAHCAYVFGVTMALISIDVALHGERYLPPVGWNVPVYLPGSLIYHVGRQELGFYPYPQPYSKVALVMWVLGSAVAAWSLFDVLRRRMLGVRRVFGRYRWRLWLLLITWAWLPVPSEISSYLVFAFP